MKNRLEYGFVRGIAFQNDDGEERHDIVKKLHENMTYVSIRLRKKHVYVESSKMTVLGLECVEKSTKKVLGFVPAELVNDILASNVRELTGHIIETKKGDLIVGLYELVPPSKAQYDYVKHLCAVHNQPLPVYDQHIYGAIIGKLTNVTKINESETVTA